MSEWISVKDRFPEHLDRVFCINAMDMTFCATFYLAEEIVKETHEKLKNLSEETKIRMEKEKAELLKEKFVFSDENGGCFKRITHWIPIPTVPERN